MPLTPTAASPGVHTQRADSYLMAFRGLNRRRVDPDEVDLALRRAKTKKATGLDGIASELYMAQPGVFAPLLARLFTAINQTDQAPEGFTDGLVVYLPKKSPRDGEIMSPADFLPITFLGADCKLYSSILSFRLVPMLRMAIPSQHSSGDAKSRATSGSRGRSTTSCSSRRSQDWRWTWTSARLTTRSPGPLCAACGRHLAVRAHCSG